MPAACKLKVTCILMEVMSLPSEKPRNVRKKRQGINQMAGKTRNTLHNKNHNSVDNSNVFCLIQMLWLPTARACRQ